MWMPKSSKAQGFDSGPCWENAKATLRNVLLTGFPADPWSNYTSASGHGNPAHCPLGLGLATGSWPWADAAGLWFEPAWRAGLPAHQLWDFIGSVWLGWPVLNLTFMIPNSRAQGLFHQASSFWLLASSWVLIKIPVPTPHLRTTALP